VSPRSISADNQSQAGWLPMLMFVLFSKFAAFSHGMMTSYILQVRIAIQYESATGVMHSMPTLLIRASVIMFYSHAIKLM